MLYYILKPACRAKLTSWSNVAWHLASNGVADQTVLIPRGPLDCPTPVVFPLVDSIAKKHRLVNVDRNIGL